MYQEATKVVPVNHAPTEKYATINKVIPDHFKNINLPLFTHSSNIKTMLNKSLYKNKKLVEMETNAVSFMDEEGRSIAEFIVEENDDGVPYVTFKPVDKPTYDVEQEFLTEVTDSDGYFQ